jgi:hypothetical protein
VWGAYDFGACNRIQKEDLQAELNTICQAVFEDELRQADFRRTVDQRWDALHMNRIIDLEIDRAAQQIKAENGYWPAGRDGRVI